MQWMEDDVRASELRTLAPWDPALPTSGDGQRPLAGVQFARTETPAERGAIT